MRILLIGFLASILFPCFIVAQKLQLWYDRPARLWSEALPLGNSSLGAMVFGGVREEVIQLNESTLWSGGPVRYPLNPGASSHLAPLRKAILQNEGDGADSLARLMQGPFSQNYLPLADLLIRIEGADDPVTDYRRWLDLDSALATTSFTLNETQYRREVFISAPDQCMIIRFVCNKKGKLNLELRLRSLLRNELQRAGDDELVMKGKAPAHFFPGYYTRKDSSPLTYEDSSACNGMRFQVRLRAHAADGKVSTDTSIRIEGATEAWIILTAATSFNGFDRCPDSEGMNEQQAASLTIEKAFAKTYRSLLKDHLRDHQAYFKRVELTLLDTLNFHSSRSLPSNERLKAYAEGNYDPGIERLYFQYGRYLLLASSRGKAPANLQGIWNDQLFPPWSSNYTININTQMNYWPAGPANLIETQEPLVGWMRGLAAKGTKVAREYYGMRGWVAHHNSDLWAMANPVGDFGRGDPLWANWYMGGNWLARHLWDHFLFTGDTIFLRDRAYPLIKGAADFTLDWLVRERNGTYGTIPSSSPENSFQVNGKARSLTRSVAMDRAIIVDLFGNLTKAAAILRTDRRYRDTLKDRLNKLFSYERGGDGTLSEWSGQREEADPQHRHISHLYGLVPGNEIDASSDTAWAAAARRSLERRGDEGTGWSKAWKINCWARLRDGERSYRLLRELMRYTEDANTQMKGGGTYPNFFDAHPPFQIDGNFGGLAGMIEMLLQSREGQVFLLPALPVAWNEGKVKGLKARGNHTVSMQWSEGKLVSATIRAGSNGPFTIRCASMFLLDGVRARAMKNSTGYYVETKLVKGRIYALKGMNINFSTVQIGGSAFEQNSKLRLDKSVSTPLADVTAPAPISPLPSPAQLRWHEMEMNAFVHFSINTFTDKEWGYGDESTTLFNPTEFNPDQWMKLFKETGFKMVILTCKHHDGFCLWPSAYTDHSVRSSAFQGGRGDIVGAVSGAAKKHGLRFGIYLSPWDRNHAAYGRPAYLEYYRKQLQELFSKYGPVTEMWFDGANGGDGFYGGARETRRIDGARYYEWPGTLSLVRSYSPDVIFFSDAGPGVRWVGNERGIAGETNWNMITPDTLYAGKPGIERLLNTGSEEGTRWIPAEVDVSIRPGWFHHAAEDSLVKTAEQLFDIYLSSVGRGSTLLLNVPPDRRGLIHEKDAEALRGLKSLLDKRFSTDLILRSVLTVSNVRGRAGGGEISARSASLPYDQSKLIDGDDQTYWATDDSVRSATIEIEFPIETKLSYLLLQEPIRLGQRIKSFRVEQWKDGWQPLAQGTTVGYKRIVALGPLTTKKIRVRIIDARACPLLSRLAIY